MGPQPTTQLKVDELLNTIQIPPQPETLLKLRDEQASPEFSLRAASELIKTDASLSAGVIKAANSPLFGIGREINSIEHAVSLLGGNKVTDIVTCLSLRAALADNSSIKMERFWDEAADVALMMKTLAAQLGSIAEDDAYLMGLFHDCGIPLLAQKCDDYQQVLMRANADSERSFTAVEDAGCGTNHAVVGYLVTKNWRIPAPIPEAILRHHDATVFEDGGHTDHPVRLLVAGVRLAEHLVDRVRGRDEPGDWARVRSQVLRIFDFTDEEFEEVELELMEEYREAALDRQSGI